MGQPTNNRNGLRRYPAALLAAFLVPAILLVATSYRLDPFRLYEGAEQEAYENTADLFWYMRLHKPYRIIAVRPDSLITGSSRAGRLPPEPMARGQGRAYNAAIPGATLYEILRTIEHAHSVEPLRRVLLGVDYAMFRRDQARTLTGFADNRLFMDHPSPGDRLRFHWQRLLDAWNTLFSRGALTANINSARGLRQSRRDFFGNGTWSSGFNREEKPWVYAMLSEQKYAEFSRDDGALDFSGLEQIMRFCEEHGIELTLLLSPTHAHLMNAIARAGGWPHYIDYQREVVERAARFSDRGVEIRVFGAEHNRALVQEAPDSARDWFRDGIHYSLGTGTNLVACLYGDPSTCEPDRSPVELNRDNIDGYLEGVDRQRETYRTRRPEWYRKLDRQLTERQNKLPAAR